MAASSIRSSRYGRSTVAGAVAGASEPSPSPLPHATAPDMVMTAIILFIFTVRSIFLAYFAVKK
jgi:hypothetical protein